MYKLSTTCNASMQASLHACLYCYMFTAGMLTLEFLQLSVRFTINLMPQLAVRGHQS